MDKLILNGKQSIKGKVKISGSKNSAVALIPAALLSRGTVSLENLPDIDDVRTMIAILENLGVNIRRRGKNHIILKTGGVRCFSPPYELVKKMRASYYLMGSLLARFGRAEVPIPGGCDLGPRPIDQHLKGFAALGTKIETEHGLVKLKAGRLRGAKIYLDVVSVGATINIMLAASGAEGTTVLENAAKEPEIVDLANFLNAMGGHVRGAGTDVIRIQGVEEFHSVKHIIIPDRIEAGTFMLAAAATAGMVEIEDVIPKHLEAVTAKLAEAGIKITEEPDRILVDGRCRLQPIDVKTFPYPGFPTDLQPLVMVLAAVTQGTSVITENVFEGRFRHVDELKRMGCRIKVEGRTAVVEGGNPLTGAPVNITDLRAGAALLVAGMAAEGETVLSGVEHIYRGYECLEQKLQGLGICLKRRSENVRESLPGSEAN